MSTPSSGSAGKGGGGERKGVPVDLGSMSEVQEQVAALSRQMEQFAARMAENERQRAEETANITASLLAVQ